MHPSFVTFTAFHHTTPRSLPSLKRVCTHPRLPPQLRKSTPPQPTMILQALWKTALSTAVYQATFFTITYVKKFDILTDFAGTTNFILVALQTFFSAGNNIRSKIVTGFVVTWAARLGGFLFSRILKWGHDRRMNKMRNNVSTLALFWSIQAVWVWVVSLPVTLLNGRPHATPLGVLDYIGWGLFICGFLIEVVADAQKLKHKMTSDRWVDSGLWRASRHPNYFGEIVLWTGIYLSCVRGLRGLQHLAVISPIFISSLLLFLSGIPLLERSADRKYGDMAEYVEYKRNTSVLIPCPVAVYRRLPEGVRRTVFLELGMYNHLGKGKDS